MRICFLLLLASNTFLYFSQGEWDYSYHFEDSAHIPYLTIAENPFGGNLWQVGAPQKVIFNSAQSIPKVIVTDTVNSYPPNNTSLFELTHYVNMEFRCIPLVSFEGYYQSDTDTLTDFGKIELSPDNGLSWITLTEDNQYTMMSMKPILTGNSGGWQYFYYDLTQLFYEQDLLGATDTIKFRFSFFSDSIDNPHDGLMFDDLRFFSDDGMGLSGLSKFQKSCYPNPAKTAIYFPFEFYGQTFELFDYSGNVSARGNIFGTLNTSSLSLGIYFIRVLNQDNAILLHQKIVFE